MLVPVSGSIDTVPASCFDGGMSQPRPTSHGPFRAEQIRSGDPYELSDGHAIECMPTGGCRRDEVGDLRKEHGVELT